MTKEQIEAIHIGQKGLYPWNKELRVCLVGDIIMATQGRRKGQFARYVTVQSTTARIGFLVEEGQSV